VRWSPRWIQALSLALLLGPVAFVFAQPQQRTNQLVAETNTRLTIADGTDWSFLGGQWTQDEQGVIRPPDGYTVHSRAFYTSDSYTDLTAEFEFNAVYGQQCAGSAGLIIRAADAGHFYFVYFPWKGQQLRAKHFWAVIAKVEGDAYLCNLKAVWVPGVPSEVERWYKVRVQVEGAKISVWVNGRFALSVTDATYVSGRVGLAGYGGYSIQNVTVRGTRVPPSPWNDAAQLRATLLEVGHDSQPMPTACVAPNGDVLIAGGDLIVRSVDQGRTWIEPVKLPEKLGGLSDYRNTMFATAQSRLIVMIYRGRHEIGKPKPEILISESPDNGHSWSDPVPSRVRDGWAETPTKLVAYGPLTETEDGTLLRFLRSDGFGDGEPQTWGAFNTRAFAIRSTDGGASWSAPIELDWPTWSSFRRPNAAEQRGKFLGSFDLSEATGVAIGNTITVLTRPSYSPMMWQCWSYDAGVTWDAAVRATFPGYAQSMIRTNSGAILCAHRYPHYSVNVSYDNGVNWDAGTVIDYWDRGMGCLIEVEPDLVLCIYLKDDNMLNQPLLAQLIRVTPDGVYPVEH